MENGSDPNIPDGNGVYPLEYAISIRSLEFVQALLNSNKIDYTKKIPKSNDVKYFKSLVVDISNPEPKSSICASSTTSKNGSNNAIENDEFFSYLHLAVKCNCTDILKEFLDRKLIDVNIKNDQGNTPLIIACHYSDKDTIRLLLSIDGIDYQHRNNQGKDAFETALSNYKCINKLQPTKEFNNKDEYCQQIMELFEPKNKETGDLKCKFATAKVNKFNFNIEKNKQKNENNDDSKPA